MLFPQGKSGLTTSREVFYANIFSLCSKFSVGLVSETGSLLCPGGGEVCSYTLFSLLSHAQGLSGMGEVSGLCCPHSFLPWRCYV